MDLPPPTSAPRPDTRGRLSSPWARPALGAIALSLLASLLAAVTPSSALLSTPSIPFGLVDVAGTFPLGAGISASDALLRSPVVVFSATFLNLTSSQLASDASFASALSGGLEGAVLASLGPAFTAADVAVGTAIPACDGLGAPTLAAAVSLNGSWPSAMALLQSSLLGGSLAPAAAAGLSSVYGSFRVGQVQLLADTAAGPALPQHAALVPTPRPAVPAVPLASGALGTSPPSPRYAVAFLAVLPRVNLDMAQLVDPAFNSTLATELSAALYRAAGVGTHVAFERLPAAASAAATASCSAEGWPGLAVNASVTFAGPGMLAGALAFVARLQQPVSKGGNTWYLFSNFKLFLFLQDCFPAPMSSHF